MIGFESINYIAALPEFFMLGMIMLVILAELFQGERFKHLGYYLSQISLIGALFLTVKAFAFETVITFHHAYIIDEAACLLKIFIYAMSFLVLLYSKAYVKDHRLPQTEFFVLTLIVALGMSVLVSAYSFITVYLGLELLSLPLYAMIAFKRNSAVCAEAAMKYFVMGAMASGMLLYGMSMLYGGTGSLEIAQVANQIAVTPLNNNLILMFGLVFVVAGVMFKLGAVPFHMWVPDVYQGSPNAVTLLIASAVKVAGFGLAMRLLVDTFGILHTSFQSILIVIAILSMALGNIVAVTQSNLKRMLAYSSIAHMGYMLLGFIAGTNVGYGAAMFYMILYALMALGAFGLLVLLSRAGYEVESIDDVRGLNVRNPWFAFLMLLVMFSMAGIPPSAGFFAKIAVLEALMGVHLVWLAALALVFAIIGVYYYIRVVKVMYFDAPQDSSKIIVPGFARNLGISVNCLVVLALGILPTGLFNLCIHAFTLN